MESNVDFLIVFTMWWFIHVAVVAAVVANVIKKTTWKPEKNESKVLIISLFFYTS